MNELAHSASKWWTDAATALAIGDIDTAYDYFRIASLGCEGLVERLKEHSSSKV